MAIPDIPVFSFRVNWKEPLDETISFLTDVMRSVEACEQRRKLRQTPRRSFDVDLLLTGPERTFWDLFIHSLGPRDVLCPLYWDVVAVTSPLLVGSTDRIDFDTTRRDWAFQAGGAAIIQRNDALTYEVVEIAAVDDEGIDLVGPVQRQWPRGTKIMPLRRAKIDGTGDMSAITAGVATISARLLLKESNPWTPIIPEDPVIYGDLPVFLDEPNWVESLSVGMEREIETLDNQVGLTYETFPLNRIMVGQQHRWFLPGKDRVADFRDLIYTNAGRAGAFWLPTFKADFKLATAAGSGASQIEVENVGFGLTGGPRDGREHIAIKHGSGTICRKILSVVPGSTEKTEKLNLDGPVGLALQPGQVRRISFMDTARFDTDEFTISHYGGAEAHHESTASFRTFRNTRVPPTILIADIPEAEMSDVQCGSTSFIVPCAPQFYNGWDYEISLRRTYTRWDSAGGLYIWPPPGGGGGNATGGAIGDYNAYFGPDSPNNQGNRRWGARRINMGDPSQPPGEFNREGVGTWNATIDVGITNYFGTPPDQLNHTSIYLYFRHWTEPFPGRLVWSQLNYTGNGDFNPSIENDIDWRDYR